MEWMILPFKRYVDFQGRSRRMEFWMFQLLNLIIAVVLAGPFYFSVMSAAFASGATGAAGGEAAMAEALSNIGGITMVMIGLYGIYVLAALIPSIAVTVRRLHDRNLTGWLYPGLIVVSLIPLIGLIASIAFLVLMFLPGTPGPNKYGPDPKDPTSASVFE